METRANRKPILSDLRESGAIEQDADLIMMLYRADYYEESRTSENAGRAEVIINKQRNGPTGSADLRWLAEYGSFESYTSSTGPDPPAPESPPLF